MYLCHVFCEIGAVRMLDEMKVVRAFLDAHPREVLVIVIEDYVPPGAQTPRGESSQWGDYHLREAALYVKRLAENQPYLTFFGPGDNGDHGGNG